MALKTPSQQERQRKSMFEAIKNSIWHYPWYGDDPEGLIYNWLAYHYGEKNLAVYDTWVDENGKWNRPIREEIDARRHEQENPEGREQKSR